MGVATHSGAVLRGSLEEVMKVLQGWKRLEVVSQKPDGGLRFGMQIPPPQEVLTEPLRISLLGLGEGVSATWRGL